MQLHTVTLNELDKIIGCLHTSPKKMKIGDNIFLCCKGVDMVVHPDFRGLGISNKMTTQVINLRTQANIVFTYFDTGNPILIKKYSRESEKFPRFPYTLMNYVRIHDINLHLEVIPVDNAWIKKIGFKLLNQYNKIKNNLSLHSTPEYNFRVSEVKCFDHRIAVFWDEIKDYYNFIMERNKDYLNWRYCDSRGGDYTVKIAEDDIRILGYCVLRINNYNKDYPRGYIVDLLTLPDRLDVTEILIKDAVEYFDDKNINSISCLIIRDHPYEKIIKKYGFIFNRSILNSYYVMHLKIDDEKNKLQKGLPNKIHMAYGDSDYI
jgi:hypothetical protein